jgi:hypothetical protein
MTSAGVEKPGSAYRIVAVVLIVVGVLALLGIGTCALGAFIVKRKVDKVASEIADGGIVLAAPPAVKAELAGPKKDYVGSWRSAAGSSLDIDPDGNMKYVKDEGGAKESITAPIAAFRGDDIEVKFGITLTVRVTEPPRLIGTTWQMKANGVAFERK